MKQTFICILALAIVTWCPAPITGRMEDRKYLEPEATQLDLARQQELMRQQGTVGSVEMQEGRIHYQSPTADPAASRNLKSFAETGGSPEDRAALNLASAADDLDRRNAKGGAWWIWIVLLVAIAGGVFMLKRWADKTIPEFPNAKKSPW